MFGDVVDGAGLWGFLSIEVGTFDSNKFVEVREFEVDLFGLAEMRLGSLVLVGGFVGATLFEHERGLIWHMEEDSGVGLWQVEKTVFEFLEPLV